jgi:protein tyrosine phosphatase (PTP) superfamily phosphohydrolase (DUF442 family)
VTNGRSAFLDLPFQSPRLNLFWIDDTLAIATRPRGGDWLVDEIDGLKAAGVSTLVSCLTRPEEFGLGLDSEAFVVREAGLAFVAVPIEDRSIPSRDSLEAVAEQINADRGSGRRVAIHCRQGLGRAPLVAAAAPVRQGVSPADVWARIEEARGQPVPETDEQRDWLSAFAAGSS